MTKRIAAVLFLFVSMPVLALNSRSAVSVNGLDTSNCAPATPCRSFTAAMAQTAAGGEVVALDSAGYGPFTISNSIAVMGAPGVHAAITATTGNAISISGLGTDHVLLRNLALIGGGGAVGIDKSSADLRVFNCLVRGFTVAGIRSEISGNIAVDHSTILDSASGDVGNPARGISIAHGSSAITDCVFAANDVGIHCDAGGSVAVVDTTITGSATGVQAIATSGGLLRADVVLKRCTVAHNSIGVFTNATIAVNFSSVTLADTLIAFNDTGVALIGGSSRIDSFGNNHFENNSSDGTAMTAVLSQ